MAQKLILDVDTGTDDAIAIMLAALHPDLELIAVTTVNGNAPVDVATDNTLRVVGIIGIDIPVYRGMAKPLLRSDFPVPRAQKPERAVHAKPLDLPPASREVQAQHAVDFLIEAVAAAPGELTLVTTAPLSNLGAALIREPRLLEGLRRLVVLGGSHAVGNVTPSAEFNMWADPEAAKLVFASSTQKTTFITLDTTHKAPLDLAFCRSLRTLSSPAGRVTAALVEQRIEAYRDRSDMANAQAAPVHDPFAVAALVLPSLLETRRVFVDVETQGELTVGRTVIDVDARSGREPNVDFASLKDPQGIGALLLEVFGTRSRIESEGRRV
ncbi:MAG: nucleoside hydrolase [Trueperaceae bacterium]